MEHGLVRISAAAPARMASVEFAWSAGGPAWEAISTDAEPADGGV